ncbi:MAG: hypothetical protein IJ151_01410 [Bacteroidales bacterium]|nr:hypothetical protein [Bacteroidales bacterium]
MSKATNNPDYISDDFIPLDESYNYSTEALLKIDEMTIIRDEEEAMNYLNLFWDHMESKYHGRPTVDPNDFRTLFRKNKELVILPTVGADGWEVDELIDGAEAALSGVIRDGDYVMLLFASSEDDCRLDACYYDDFREAMKTCFGKRARLIFGSTIPDYRQPYCRSLQASILILHS